MDNKFPNTEVGSFTVRQRELQLWWYGLPAGVRSPVWPGILVTLIIVGLLLAFHQVVSGAVQQSELRLKAVADGKALLQVQDTTRAHPSNVQAVVMNLYLPSNK